MSMIRKAFKMQLFSENVEEYVKRHNPIWEELEATLKGHGAHNYSIFLDEETYQLFAYVELESEEKWNQIAETSVCKKWWKHMAALMPTNADDSPVSVKLREVFHLK